MVKKVKIEAGPVSVEWEKEMKNPNADPKFIKKQIDHWIFEIDNSETTDLQVMQKSLEKFLTIMREFGHTSVLDEEYKQKFLKIKAFHDKNYGGFSISIKKH